MKSILFIDYVLQKGHVNFDKIHIDSLMTVGKVTLVLHKYLADRLPYDSSQYALIIPECLRYREGHPFINRIIFILTLLYIKLKIKLSSYDNIVVSYCDEISLGMVPLRKGMFIISHNNAAGLSHSIKRYFCKRLAKSSKFLLFNSYIQEHFHKYNIDNTEIVSHGCLPAFNVRSSEESRTTNVFHPSAKVDSRFADTIINDITFNEFLRREDIVLILRNIEHLPEHCTNIKSLNYYLTKEEYQKYFVESDAILVAYPPIFNLQVSGVSFECVSNSKPMIIKETASLEYCKDFYNYTPFFANIQQLQDLLLKAKSNTLRCIVTPESLAPDYSRILSL